MLTMVFLEFSIIFAAFSIAVSATDGQYNCISPQLLELGKYELLKCSFSKQVYGIYWFNSTNVLDDQPIIGSQQKQIKRNSKEFDLHDNGSLIINNVSFSHEITFVVLILETEDADPVTRNVEVQVIVKPGVLFPVIDKCTPGERICLYEMSEIFEIQCTVGYSRPSIALIWNVRTKYGDREVTQQGNQTITIDLKEMIDAKDVWFSSSPIILICKVLDNPFVLEHETSLLVLQNPGKNVVKTPTTVVFNRYNNFVLDCNLFENGVMVWEHAETVNEDFETILYAGIGQENFRGVYKSPNYSENNGSLVVSSPNFEQEGIYQCTSSNVIDNDVKVYDAICIVLPSPPYPVIEGCNNTNSGCVLYYDEHHGNVSCSVIGIFPEVGLSVTLLSSENHEVIEFNNQERGSEYNGVTYTISLVSQFNVKPTFTGQVTVMCLTTKLQYEQLNVRVEFHLNFSRAKRNQDIEVDNGRHDKRHLAWLCLLILLPIIFAVVLVWKSRQKKTSENTVNREESVPLQTLDAGNEHSPQTKTTEGSQKYEETVPLNDQNNGKEHSPQTITTEGSQKYEETVPLNDQNNGKDQDSKTTFIQQLKARYKSLYNAVKPLPHVTSVMRNVNDLYVNGRIQFCTSNKKWRDIKSVKEIFTDERIEKRCIIEGPPGYGKSTLCLQLVYSWCYNALPPVPRVDLLLFFCGRELKDIPTLAEAVKQLILPRNSEIKEDTIECILEQFDSKSKVIVIDGFDEIETDSTLLDDFLNNDYNFRVVVTTRSSCLPRRFLPSTTRIKLFGFNDIDRRVYIDNFFKDDKTVRDEVQKQLEIYWKEDPFFMDLMKVPFFFVVVVHSWKGGKSSRNQISASQTVKLLVSSLISHMESKSAYSSQDSPSLKLPTSDEFNEDVFISITSKVYKRWSERDFRLQFGDNVYTLYKNIGILEMDTPGSLFSTEKHVLQDYQDNVEGVPMVTIRHMFFREWLAAKYIVSTLNYCNTEEANSLVELSKPVDNILRFASGIDTATASEILKILLRDEEAMKLAISCVMEVKKEKFLNLEEQLSKLCQSSVEIDVTDNLYIQRKLRDFVISVSEKIPSITFPSVILRNSFDSVNEHGDSIFLKSRLKLSSNVSTMELCIVKRGGELTPREIEQLIEYISKSKMITSLSLERCVVPMNLESVTAGYQRLHEVFKVSWRPEGRSKRFTWYYLNSSGHWEDSADKDEITEAEYQRLLETIKESQRYQPFTFVTNR